MDATVDATVLADIELDEAGGGKVLLGDTWRDGPIVLVWLRHYG